MLAAYRGVGAERVDVDLVSLTPRYCWVVGKSSREELEDEWYEGEGERSDEVGKGRGEEGRGEKAGRMPIAVSVGEAHG